MGGLRLPYSPCSSRPQCSATRPNSLPSARTNVCPKFYMTAPRQNDITMRVQESPGSGSLDVLARLASPSPSSMAETLIRDESLLLIGSYDRSCVQRASELELQMCPSSRYRYPARPPRPFPKFCPFRRGKWEDRGRRPSIYLATSLSGEICPPSSSARKQTETGILARGRDKASRCTKTANSAAALESYVSTYSCLLT